MGAIDLLQELRQSNFSIQTDGARLMIHPSSKLREDQRRVIQEIKAELIAALRPAYHWRFTFPDGQYKEVFVWPPAHEVQMREDYPEAVCFEALQVASCRHCLHRKHPDLSESYCSVRDDLPYAYGAGHPLRALPVDNGASCMKWQQEG